MWDQIDEKLGEIEGRAKGESVKKYSSDLTALGRVSVPDDVGKVVGGFLAGADSEFVTGQSLLRLQKHPTVSRKGCDRGSSCLNHQFYLYVNPLRNNTDVF